VRSARRYSPEITQATICNPQWSTKTIRPPASYTNNLKKQQLNAARYVDKTPSHYEEDHLISLELGGHPRDHVPPRHFLRQVSDGLRAHAQPAAPAADVAVPPR